MKRAACNAALFQLKKTLKGVPFNSTFFLWLSIYFKNELPFHSHLNWNITTALNVYRPGW
jgi:hypothetical protein